MTSNNMENIGIYKNLEKKDKTRKTILSFKEFFLLNLNAFASGFHFLQAFNDILNISFFRYKYLKFNASVKSGRFFVFTSSSIYCVALN